MSEIIVRFLRMSDGISRPPAYGSLIPPNTLKSSKSNNQGDKNSIRDPHSLGK